ncbi:DUF2628 domain-containing protein [Bacillus cereus group sp. BfR-BA-01383]|uniref:DUF2628 domain-containing protein n=1 Tax=Bacillus cereus group sp. BfR-BA-01383 TaxID=2920327 RepID=UPI001F598E3C|nr:DUF2628 domain-containing protein [Bacillus cereus group sp. BfR-BA-01383]
MMYVKDTVLQETISPQELHKVVRKNTAYYDFKWGQVKNPEKENTWNWVACIFPHFWLAYRKMYKLFIILTLLAVPTLIIATFIDIPMWIDFIIYVGTMLFTGWQGNRLYYKHVTCILRKVEDVPDYKKEYYLHSKGGAHIGVMIGLQAIVLTVVGAISFGLSYLPTEPNIKNVVRLSLEGDVLEAITDNPNWKYVKKEKEYDIVEFIGYDYEEKKNVKIKFAVYLNDDYFEWQEAYLNNKKLSEEELDEYRTYVEENMWFF